MTNGNSLFDLKTVIQLVTVAALVGGSWYVQGERIEANTALSKDLKADIVLLNTRLNTVERDIATMVVRYENINNLVMELRRQSSILPEPAQ
jgi:hypothetical protein